MTSKTVTKLLKADHDKVRTLFEQLQGTTDRGVKTRQDLREKVALELDLHTQVEEQIVYPALKGRMEENEQLKMYYEAVEEHRAAKLVLDDFMKCDAATPEFAGKVKVLTELVTHHADEEEEEMFPVIEELFDKDELVAMGEEVQAFKDAHKEEARQEVYSENRVAAH